MKLTFAATNVMTAFMIITPSLVINGLHYTDDEWLQSSTLICIAELIISYYTHRTAEAITSVYCKDTKKLCNYTSMKMFCSCQL